MGAYDSSLETQNPSNRKAKKSPPKSQTGVELTLEGSLNHLLANEYALFTKTLKYHWNVTGERFYSIHEFLDEHYQKLLINIDNLAERIREIKAFPIGTMTEFKEKTDIVENPGNNPDANRMLVDLMQDHDLIRGQIQSILASKERFKMQASGEDFLIGLLKTHDEMSWMLRSSLN